MLEELLKEFSSLFLRKMLLEIFSYFLLCSAFVLIFSLLCAIANLLHSFPSRNLTAVHHKDSSDSQQSLLFSDGSMDIATQLNIVVNRVKF